MARIEPHMQSIFRRGRHICWGNYHSRILKSQRFGGETMQTADVAITRPSLWGLPQFGNVVFEDASSFWQTGKMSNGAKSGLLGELRRIISEWWEQCVVGQCARAVPIVTARNVSMPLESGKRIGVHTSPFVHHSVPSPLFKWSWAIVVFFRL
jgi:hypothetical protein